MPDVKGLVMSNAANKTQGKHIHNYSTFDKSLSYRLANTLRFGEYTPSFMMEGVPEDEISVNSVDRIDSLSLKAPFKGSIRKVKESFKVPNMAILPMQWDRIYAQNSNGDDVPQDANCVIMDFPSTVTQFFESLFAVIRNFLEDVANGSVPSASDCALFLTSLMRTIVTGEYFFSAGSLLHVCGYKAGYQMFTVNVNDTYIDYDQWFDRVVFKVFEHIISVAIKDPSGKTYLFKGLSPDNAIVDGSNMDFRGLIELFRENPLSYFTSSDIRLDSDYGGPITANSDYDSWSADLADLLLSSTDEFGVFSHDPTWWIPTDNSGELADDVTALNPTSLNLSRLLAYQLVCAHFYTNSSIDFVYSAELYRQYIHYLYIQTCDASNPTDYSNMHFSWNGIELEYDWLSGHILKDQFFFDKGYGIIPPWNAGVSILGAKVEDYPVNLSRFAAMAAVFGFNRSLRYGDYFTSSRPRPLAPINTDVSVDNNSVSVVDITRNIQAQRFANAVMRSRSKIEEYVKSLFGKAPQPDYHNPFFLSREEETIFGDEVQNTAEGQISNPNSRTANFAANTGRFTFTFHNDDEHPCIYLQIISFDIRRAYTRSVDRQFLHLDRFDMFNPDFQYIGDQPVYGIELGYANVIRYSEVFGYQSRDMEYKQRFDQASGGFLKNLPGWILTDMDRNLLTSLNIDPDFIRSYNTELDQFFLSLTGFSLGSYFHFVCITDNNVNARRAMAVDPQILA